VNEEQRKILARSPALLKLAIFCTWLYRGGCCAVSSCNFCITQSSIVILFRGLHHKNIKCVPGAIFTNVSLMSRARDPIVAQPMLAPSQFPLTHDFDRQTQARFLRALRKSYLKADWNNIDLATVQRSRPCSFWQLQASFWVIVVQVLLSGLENPRLPHRSSLIRSG